MSAAAALVLAGYTAGCGESASPAVDAVQSYMSALGEGDYASACSLIDNRTKQSLLRHLPPRTTCPSVFRHCLPNRTTILNKDQTQLLYANIDISVEGSKAKAAMGGTAVGKALKHVTLSDERGVWRLTSFGQAIETCHLGSRHGRRPGKTSKTA